MIDNYDSFTFNLVHYCQQLDAEVIVRRNDQLTLADIKQLSPSHIIISPGPCDPDKAGLSLAVVNAFKGEIPILGVCLGHQVIGQAFGGKVVKAKNVVHGKTSSIYHTDKGIFNGLKQGFSATRYHSLVIQPDSLPESLEVTAWTQSPSGEKEYIMGIKHQKYPIEGVQFHPESVLSEYGLTLLKRFISSPSNGKHGVDD